jgi:hypothetical protein
MAVVATTAVEARVRAAIIHQTFAVNARVVRWAGAVVELYAIVTGAVQARR